MNPPFHQKLRSLWKIATLLVCLSFSNLHGQDEVAPAEEEEDVSVEALYLKAGSQMQDGKWQEAVATFNKLFDLSTEEFLFQDYGPGAGGLYFDYALALLQTGDYEGASAAFEICYNADDLAKKYDSAVSSNNPRKKTALFQWGFCEQQLGHPGKALELYDKYIASDPGTEELQRNRVAFWLRKGTALVQADRIEEGEKLIQELFDNQQEWGVAPPFLMQAIYDVGLNYIDMAKRGEDVAKITDIGNRFLNQTQAAVDVAPFDKFRFGFIDRMLSLGMESTKVGLNTLALRYFSMIPPYDDVVADIRQRALLYGENIPGPYMEQINKISALQAQPTPQDVEVKQLIAAAWEGLGNLSAPRSIYAYLTTQYPDVEQEKRAEILHEAARYSSGLGDYGSAQYYGELFMDEMPEDHKLRDNVATYMLQSLFTSGQHEEVIRIAEDIRGKYEEGDEKRELADALYAMSQYILQNSEAAAEAFDLHIKSFEESQNREMISYHRANNQLFLGQFGTAKEYLQEFLEAYPDSARYLDSAYSDLALARFNLEEYSAAIAAVDTLAAKRPNSRFVDRAMNLKGDSLMAMTTVMTEEEKIAETEKAARDAYLLAAEKGKALEAASDDPEGHKEAVGEGLSKAVDLFVSAGMNEEAVKYYDEFMASYKGTNFEPQISVFTLPALIAVGRTEDGLVQIEKMINFMGSKPPEEQDLELLRQAIGSYSEASKEARGVEETIAKFDNFPGLDPNNQALLTWLKIQKVIVLQEQRGTVGKDSPEFAQYETRIADTFEELKTFEKSELSEFALQQIGLYIKSTDNPFLAIPYFEELLLRTNPEADQFKGPAELAIAEIEMRRPDKANQDSARDRLIRIIKQYDDPELKPEATLNLGRIYANNEQWADAKEQFGIINKKKDWFKKDRATRAESNFYYGLAAEKAGDPDGALKVYHTIHTVYGAYPEWATRSVERIMEIGLNQAESIENTAEEPTKQRDKQVEFYTFLKEKLYKWQKFEEKDAPSGALGRLRRQVDLLRAEIGITTQEETAINFSMGLDANGNVLQ